MIYAHLMRTVEQTNVSLAAICYACLACTASFGGGGWELGRGLIEKLLEEHNNRMHS